MNQDKSTKKSLGQHWLFDRLSLEAMATAVDVQPGDTVLEIGPGLGTLTEILLQRGAHVVAVEFDASLIDDLKAKFADQDFKLIHKDILQFNFLDLPQSYKICANIPYYLTSNLLRHICESSNRPTSAALLVQKEVAERVSAIAGDHSILSISVQLHAQADLGIEVPAKLFTPPPKVDSRILLLEFYENPLSSNVEKAMRVVRAGFSSPRKKLRSSLAAGLAISKADAEKILLAAEVDPNRRAQTLELDEWLLLASKI